MPQPNGSWVDKWPIVSTAAAFLVSIGGGIAKFRTMGGDIKEIKKDVNQHDEKIEGLEKKCIVITDDIDKTQKSIDEVVIPKITTLEEQQGKLLESFNTNLKDIAGHMGEVKAFMELAKPKLIKD